MKITIRLDNAEITFEQKMDETAFPALANEFHQKHIIKSIKEIVTEVIRLKLKQQ